MSKKVIRENLFLTIAKELALFQIKRKAPEVMSKLQSDPELETAVQNLQKYSSQLETLLSDYCKKKPNSDLCKGYNNRNK